MIFLLWYFVPRKTQLRRARRHRFNSYRELSSFVSSMRISSSTMIFTS